MTMTHDEGKPSLESLAHHGVKGMRWGTTRVKASGREIRSARKRLGVEQDKLFTAQRAVKKTGTGHKALEKQTTKFLNNPDRVTAVRLTKGEQVAQVLIGGPLGLVAIGGTTAYSRTIEKKQATGAYNRR
jgi:hypothetical protein